MEEKSRIFVQIRRFLSLVLCIVLIVTQDSENFFYSFADENDESYYLYLNEASTAVQYNDDSSINWDAARTVTYNSDLNFAVKSEHYNDAIKNLFYLDNITFNDEKNVEVDTSKALISNGVDQNTALPVGNYYLFYETENRASLGEASGETAGHAEFVMKVTPATLATATNLAWTDNSGSSLIASWDAVSKDDTDKDITGGTVVKYQVKLFYSTETEPIFESDLLSETSIDLISKITKGYGDYYFTVTAQEYKESGAVNYSESVATSASYTYADKDAPVISKYTVVTDENGVISLTGTANDAGSGISAYAFVPEGTNVDASYSGWILLTEGEIQKGTDYTATVALSNTPNGKLFFYVKDTFGNITHQDVCRSDQVDPYNETSVYHTSIELSKYYNNLGSSLDKKYDLLNEEEITLPSEGTTEGQMKHIGYTFNGWFSDSSYSGSKITTVKPGTTSGIDKGSQITLYGNWNSQNITFSTNPSSIEKTYDGTESEIIAALSDSVSYDAVSWQWYKKGSAGESDTQVGEAQTNTRTATLKLTNVSESGTYYARVTITVNGEESRTADSEICTVNIAKRQLNIKIADATSVYGTAATGFSFALATGSESASR